MENIFKYVSSAVFIAGAWNLINGVLHDVFALRSEHGKQYDRNLLRLLMDGHVLITCGIILMIMYGPSLTPSICILRCGSSLIEYGHLLFYDFTIFKIHYDAID